MIARQLGLVASIVLAALAASTSNAQERTVTLQSASEVGRRIETMWSATHELSVVRLVTEIGEREPSAAELGLLARGRESVTLVDEVRAEDAVGPRDFHRRYAAATAELTMHDKTAPPGADQLSRVTFESDLVGAGVRHVRAADGTIGRHYDGREARESLLAHVGGPLDFAALLPKHELALGAEWPVEPMALRVLFAPAGELGWRAPVEGADPQLARSFAQGLGGNLQIGFAGVVSGKATGQLFELAVSGNERLAILRYTFDVTLAGDGTAFARRRALDNERDQGVDILAATSLHRLHGTAELRWSVEGKRPLDARVTAEEQVSLSVLAQPEDGERARQTVEFAGKCTAELAVKPMLVESSPVPR
jgi:hypothetical protein